MNGFTVLIMKVERCFEKLRMKNNFYIDKIDFIREWWDADDEVMLITRPRRFGKTLTMSMVEKFFPSIMPDDPSCLRDFLSGKRNDSASCKELFQYCP